MLLRYHLMLEMTVEEVLSDLLPRVHATSLPFQSVYQTLRLLPLPISFLLYTALSASQTAPSLAMMLSLGV